MAEFIWIEWNIDKIANHYLTTDEVEFAWHNRRFLSDGNHPMHGPYTVSEGMCPSGRVIRIVWRYDVDRDGETKVFVITAY